MSLVRSGRFQQINNEFPNYSLLSIQGTRFRQSKATPVPVEQHSQGQWLEFHCNYGMRSNKHAGLNVCLNKRWWNKSNVTAISYPGDARLAGRAMAIRLQRDRVDLLVVALYAPPFQHEVSVVGYALLGWGSRLLSQCPSRTTMVRLGDLNCRVGYVHRGGGYYLPQSRSVGPCQPDCDNLAGAEWRNVCDQFRLAMSNTFWGGQSTFWKEGEPCLRIDFCIALQRNVQRG